MEWAVGREVPHLAEESTDTLLGEGKPFLFSNVALERLPLLQQMVPYMHVLAILNVLRGKKDEKNTWNWEEMVVEGMEEELEGGRWGVS